jgi:hypothetical protein
MMKDENEDARRGTIPLRLAQSGSNCGMDDPNKLSMFSNREEIRELKEVIDALIKRVHRLELRVLPPKSRNPWMGEPLPRK